MSDKMTFERGADTTLETVRATYAQRGGEYADSWALENQCARFTAATLERFGIKFTPEQVRLLQAAVIVDIKDSRINTQWKPDSVVDGIAYRALYAALRDEYEAAESS